MLSANSWSSTRRDRNLVLIFCLWKTLLLGLAASCPGPGYDTSAYILFDRTAERHHNFPTLSRADRLALNLYRWDALYFVDAAEHGQVHEQQWAFSWAYSRLLGALGQFFSDAVEHPSRYYIVAGIIVSNVCHLLSVLVLSRLLTLALTSTRRHPVAFVASVLHILTPASLFMSAPYTEAIFSLLNMTGMLCYAKSKLRAERGHASLLEDVYKLSSGLFFASATLMRSNGLLSGLILLYDLGSYIPHLSVMQLSYPNVRSMFATCVAGMFVICGFFGPQYVAFREFCYSESGLPVRTWCNGRFPSVYSWVQSHYWNVGFFRYWTIANLPLFLLAAPVLWLLMESSTTTLRAGFEEQRQRIRVPKTTDRDSIRKNPACTLNALPELALPQLVLAIAALTSFHVQIVNRIASGYPTWYMAMAQMLLCDPIGKPSKRNSLKGQIIIRGIVMYALIQGMLYASFLPPA